MAQQISDDEVLDLIATEALLDRGNLTRELPLKDVGIASLDLISILFEVEDRYGVHVEESDFAQCGTLGAFVDLLKSRVVAAA
ncbi:acyl carrier protein [Phenylobacterium sp.]|jgi:acyl carrier protein|uniref:acyl carrier protein n=1 Tax=Phenylobacterium sp. TaxID=1871053 RepID=UPI002F3F600E